jgi:hypothetical protein
MKERAQRNVMQETTVPAVPKLVQDLDEFRKKVENRTTKMAQYRKYHPSTSVWKNKSFKPVRENYEQQSRDRQFVANERKTSAEHRHDQLSFSDAEEGVRSRAVSSDARAKKSKKKQERSASEEIQKENKRRKVSAPEKKSRTDNSPARKKITEEKKDKTIKSLQESLATLTARLSRMEAKQNAERRRSKSESDDNRRAKQREQKKQKKSLEKKRSEKKRRHEDTDESTDSEPETDNPRKKSSETRAKLRDKTTISPEKMKRKEILEELKMKRRKSIERRQSQHDEDSSSEEEQQVEKVAPLKKPPTLQLESSSEEEQPEERIAPSKRPAPVLQSESSSESELESEVEEECEMSDAGASMTSNAPPDEPFADIQFSPRSPDEKKPILCNILASLKPSRIPTLIDDEQHDAVANQLMKIESASSASQTACKEAAVNNLDAVAPRVLTSGNEEDIQVVNLEDDSEIEDSDQEIVPVTENHPEEVVPETSGNAERVVQMDKKDHALKLDKLIKDYQQYLHVEYEDATKLTRKYRRKMLEFDETLPLGSSIPAYKMSMLLAHLQDNITTKHT